MGTDKLLIPVLGIQLPIGDFRSLRFPRSRIKEELQYVKMGGTNISLDDEELLLGFALTNTPIRDDPDDAHKLYALVGKFYSDRGAEIEGGVGGSSGMIVEMPSQHRISQDKKVVVPYLERLGVQDPKVKLYSLFYFSP